MTKAGILSVLLLIGLNALAAPKLTYTPDVSMSVDELLSMPSENRAQVAKNRGTEFIAALEKRAFDKTGDYKSRWKALTLAAQIQGARSEPTLKKALLAKEWYMRNAALLAYRNVLPSQAPQVALGLLKDKALIVRSAAVSALADSSHEQMTRETLWGQLENKTNFRKNQSLFIRGQILSILSASPLEKEMPLFVKSLNEKDIRMHQPAIAALEKVTAKKMGKVQDPVGLKRDLWIKWAKNQDL